MNLSTTSRRTRMLIGSSVVAVGLACGGSAIAYADGFGPDASGEPTQTEQSAPAEPDRSVQPDAGSAGPGTDCAAPHPGGPGMGGPGGKGGPAGPGKGGPGMGGEAPTPPTPPADGEAPTPPTPPADGEAPTPPTPPTDGEAPTPPNASDAPAGCPAPPAGCAP